jgi:hypothetical protein
MSVEEINDELKEHSEHAREPFDRKVAVTTAIIAALLAIVSVTGHVLSTDEILAQQKASDQWAYYQSKAIRRYESEIARDMIANAAQGPQTAAKYAANVQRYEKESEEIQNEARKLENESHLRGRQAFRAHIGEVFLEIGIVLASLAILTKRAPMWHTSIVSALIGVGIAMSTAMIR